MSSPVELPADGNPLTETNLLHALTAASSTAPQQIKAGTSQLQAWETRDGYFGLLQDAFIQTSLPMEVRLLSLIQLKNGVDKYWRKSANNAINMDERSKIRSRLLQSGIDEARDNLANLNAIATAKIARYDYPTQWPDLIKDLIELIKAAAQPSSPPKKLSRILLITHHVIKELATIRLQRNRANMLAFTPSFFTMLRDLYIFKKQQWQEELGRLGSDFSLQLMAHMNDNERILKIIRRLIIYGYDYPHRSDEVQDFWRMTQADLQLYLQMLHQTQLHQAYLTSAGQHLKQIAKIHVDIGTEHPVSLALLPDSVSLIHVYWNSAKALRSRQLSSPDEMTEELTSFYDGFNLRALLLLRGCFKSAFTASQHFKYKNAEGKEEPPRAKELMKNELLQDAFINELYSTIIELFFVYTENDIEIFTTEPEEWEMREGGGGDAYERSVRPCAERLFLDIAIHYKDLIINSLLEKLANMCDPRNDNVLIKDAAYSAIGVAAPILHKHLDFNNFLSGTIIPELQSEQPMHSIIRRRIAVLLSQWISLDISDANRPLIYQVFQHLLDKSIPLNDQVVRITAGKQFSEVVIAWEFDAAQFLQFGASILQQLVELIQEVELLETKLALLNTIGSMVVAMDHHVTAYAEQIVTLLPTLWVENSSENLMKQSIVSILFKLVKTMRADSGPFHAMMLPTIKQAMEPGSETQLYLLDDSLDLWMAIIKQTRTPQDSQQLPPDLATMIPLVFPLFEMETDYIKKALKLIASYILLIPSLIFDNNIRAELCRSFTSLLNVRKVDIIDAVADDIELLLRAAESIGGQQAVDLIVGELTQRGFMNHILNSLYADWITHQSTGPNRKEPPPDWRNETNYFGILARIVMISPNSFFSAVGVWAQGRQKSLNEVMPDLLQEWFNHMDAVGTPIKTKLLCLALTKLLETGESWILAKLQDLMAIWTSTVVELRDGDDKISDSLVYTNSSLATDRDVPEDERNRAVMYSDPVHTINLQQFIKYHLDNAINRCGGGDRFQEEWLVNVDKDVVKSFGELGIM